MKLTESSFKVLKAIMLLIINAAPPALAYTLPAYVALA